MFFVAPTNFAPSYLNYRWNQFGDLPIGIDDELPRSLSAMKFFRSSSLIKILVFLADSCVKNLVTCISSAMYFWIASTAFRYCQIQSLPAFKRLSGDIILAINFSNKYCRNQASISKRKVVNKIKFSLFHFPIYPLCWFWFCLFSSWLAIVYWVFVYLFSFPFTSWFYLWFFSSLVSYSILDLTPAPHCVVDVNFFTVLLSIFSALFLFGLLLSTLLALYL